MTTLCPIGPLRVTEPKTANYSVQAGELVLCDVATTGSFTVTLPASPRINHSIGVKLQTASGARTVTLARNGNTIGGAAADQILYVAGDCLQLQFDGAGDWLIAVDGLIPHACSLRRNTAQSIPSGTTTKIDLNNVLIDQGQLGDPTTNNRIDIRRSGIYLLTASLYLPGFVLPQSLTGRMRVNGSDVSTEQVLANAALGLRCSWPHEHPLTAGDFVELFVDQNTGSNQSTSTTASIMPTLAVRELR
ncbi:MAG: hypothetical protein IH991_19735 [Planctomycetes bacterium]|nr:hypothetical protein [Planctomycetota bacterium]